MSIFRQTVITPFLDIIARFPERNALCIAERFYTYRDFSQKIAGIVLAIRERSYNQTHIGLVVHDDMETYASIFAIWIAGFAYVPLHPQQPLERNLEITGQAEIGLILDSEKESMYRQAGMEVLQTQQIPEAIETDLHALITEESKEDRKTAYILFTSGSTGKPKGVVISRGNLGAFMKSFWESGIHVVEHDRCLQCFDLTFDVSVQSFLAPLTRGACIYTIPHDQIKYSYAYGLLEDHKLTFGAMPPSLVRYLKPYFDEIHLPHFRCNIMTAEASPLDLLQQWAQCIPNAEIFDFYGPTEATIYCTFYKFNRSGKTKELNGMLSIGKPMPGMTAVILDENNGLCATGEKGELCISGPQLTPGYWKNDEKNKQAFFTMEFEGEMQRFYRTGDSCYFDGDGDIMLEGRMDNQMKIQGYRIEPGEIEYHARHFLNGQNAVVIAHDNDTGNTELTLFIEGRFQKPDDLIAYLNTKLPRYMIPARVFVEEVFPLNTSGKVDRLKLKSIL